MSKEGNYRGWVIVAVSFLILMFIFATCISCMGVYLKPVIRDIEDGFFAHNDNAGICNDIIFVVCREAA